MRDLGGRRAERLVVGVMKNGRGVQAGSSGELQIVTEEESRIYHGGHRGREVRYQDSGGVSGRPESRRSGTTDRTPETGGTEGSTVESRAPGYPP